MKLFSAITAGACHIPTRLSVCPDKTRLAPSMLDAVGFARVRDALSSATEIIGHFPLFEGKRKLSK